MRLFIPIALLTMVVLSGCTPAGDGVLRKGSTGREATTSVALEETISAPVDMESSVLDAPTRVTIQTYGPLIKSYASRYGFDWRLILAVMRQESRFSSTAVSHRGAYGLMQIMPVTGEEVAGHLGLEDITLPQNNIKGGIFYLRKMYDLIQGKDESERVRLSLAAYNAGIGRVYDAQQIAAYMNEDPRTWQSIQDALPLLSKRYYTLHRDIWAAEKPRSGWFGDSGETIEYVNSVIAHYDEYRLLLN